MADNITLKNQLESRTDKPSHLGASRSRDFLWAGLVGAGSAFLFSAKHGGVKVGYVGKAVHTAGCDSQPLLGCSINQPLARRCYETLQTG